MTTHMTASFRRTAIESRHVTQNNVRHAFGYKKATQPRFTTHLPETRNMKRHDS